MNNDVIKLGSKTYEFAAIFDKITDYLLSYYFLVFMVGLLYVCFLEWRNILNIIKKKEKLSYDSPLARKSYYLLAGIILTLVSCSLADLFINNIKETITINESGPSYQKYTGEMDYYSLLKNVIFHYIFLGLSFVGIILTLSAEGRWMVNLSKFSATLIFFLPVLFVLNNQLDFLFSLF